VARPKPVIVPLHELTPGQHADFFALLAERNKHATRDGKPFYSCRFRDLKRTVAFMVWADGGYYDQCEGEWKVGQFFKIRGAFGEHERYGPQIEVQQIRLVNDADRADGFDPAEFVEGSRFDADAMLGELRAEVEKHIADEPLRRLVLTILERHAEPLKRLPATQRHFYPFPGGLLEHTLSVVRSCIDLAERYAARYPDLQPPLNRDL
jgi:3'-5' exoribonuclease